MEFTITCPIDGPIDVGFEDIDTVVLRERDRADITFSCPHCGSEITVTAVIPSFLLAAIQALAEDDGSSGVDGLVALSSECDVEDDPAVVQTDGRIESYCEYFRRQLAGIDSVEAAVAEMDFNSKRVL